MSNLKLISSNSSWLESLRLVVLDCPYETWNDPPVREWFGKMVALKLMGYQKEYPWGILPLDGSDFIGTHLMVCEEREGQLLPLLAYKSISLGRCRIHQSTFPVLGLAMGCRSERHVAALEAILARHEADPSRLSYDGSWTIHPEARRDQQRTTLLREIMQAVHVLHHERRGTQEFLSLGAVRFKVEQFLGFWGYRPILDLSGVMDPLRLHAYFNEKVMMMHLVGEFSPAARALAEKYRSLWGSRIEIQRAPAHPLSEPKVA
jgi:hypothetical protein